MTADRAWQDKTYDRAESWRSPANDVECHPGDHTYVERICIVCNARPADLCTCGHKRLGHHKAADCNGLEMTASKFSCPCRGFELKERAAE